MSKIVESFKQRIFGGRIFTNDEVVALVKQRDDLLKAISTPAPMVETVDTGTESDIRLPRVPFAQELYYMMRWQSVILRMVCYKIKQEIFRETRKDGWTFEPKFRLKCVECGAEYDNVIDSCQFCDSETLRTPISAQKKVWEKFALTCNKADQSFLTVCSELEDDLNTTDDLFLVVLKEYIIGPHDELYAKVVGLMRGDPTKFRIVSNLAGERGGRYWVCPSHRDHAEETPGRCTECQELLRDVHYVETEAGGKNAIKYYIEGEVIHASKYEPSRLYGISPVFTLWVITRTLQLIDKYNQNLYEKGRLKGVLAISTDNKEYLKSWWAETQKRLRNDPHYMPVVALESGEKGKGRAEFVRLIDSLKDMQVTEYKEEIRQNISSLYGVSPIFQADISTGGGLNNEGLQITVTDRAVEYGQSIYHEDVFPRLLDMLHIDDWKILLKPSRELDEMSELERMNLKVDIAQKMFDMGWDVEYKDDEFVFTGKATRPAATEGFGGELGNSPPQQQLPEGRGDNRAKPDNVEVEQPATEFSKEYEEAKKKAYALDALYKIMGGSSFADMLKTIRDVEKEIEVKEKEEEEDPYPPGTPKKLIDEIEEHMAKVRPLQTIEVDWPDEAEKTKEPGGKIEDRVRATENVFLHKLNKVYERELFNRLAKLDTKVSQKALFKEIDKLTAELKPAIEKVAVGEVIRAYQAGQELVEEFAKMSPIIGTQMGKVRSARRLTSIMPKHEIYNEPFMGGANTFLKKEKAKENHLNDFDQELVAVYQTVQKGGEEIFNFFRKANWKPSERLFQKLKSQDTTQLSDAARAYRKLYLRKHSFNNGESNFKKFNLGVDRKDWASKWMKTLDKMAAYTELFKGVNFTAGDWKAPTFKADSPETYHFFDPPYNTPKIIAKFRQEMIDHVPKLKGKWMITFADDEGIKKAFKNMGFNVDVVKYRNLAVKGDNKGERTEVIITNYPVKIPKDTLFKSEQSFIDEPDTELKKEEESTFAFDKADTQVLRGILKRNPFWGAFQGMDESLSDKLKEHIAESYEAPNTARFKSNVRDVKAQYKQAGEPVTEAEAERIAYGRIGKFNLSKVIGMMKRTTKSETYRLERIARTETTAVTAKGREMAFRKTDPDKTGLYDWFGINDARTSDQCHDIEKEVKRIGKGKGVLLLVLKEIMQGIVDKYNRGKKSKWANRDWSPHANCRRVLRRRS